MAINTANERRSVAGMPPGPDGTIASPDFQQIAGLYSGIRLFGRATVYTNPALLWMLDQRATRFRPTETVTRGVTTTTWPTTGQSTGIRTFVQAMDPQEAQEIYGYEEDNGERRYLAFWHSTAALEYGDLVQATRGPYNGLKWWIRGLQLGEDPGSQHLETLLELTETPVTGEGAGAATYVRPNPSLDYMLNQTATRYRPVEAVTRGVTGMTWPSTGSSTGLSCHIQAMDPQEVAVLYGYEENDGQRRYTAFWHSTIGVQVGDLIEAEDGPYEGKKFWVRGREKGQSVAPQHLQTHLELTEETVTVST